MKVVIVAALMVAVVAVGCGDRAEKPTPAVTPVPTLSAPVGPIQPVQSPTVIPRSTVPSGQRSVRCTGGAVIVLFDALFPTGTEYHEKGAPDPVIGIRVMGCFTDPAGASNQIQTMGTKLAGALFSKPSGYKTDDEFYSVAIALLESYFGSYTAPSATLVINGTQSGQILQVAPLYRQSAGKIGPKA